MRYQGFEVTISVDQEFAEEYGTTLLADGGVVSCFIPSETGKQFKIKGTNLTLEDAVMKCYIDGRYIHGAVARSEKSGYIPGIWVSPTQIRPFVFSNIQWTDNDEINIYNPQNLEALGTIELRFWRMMMQTAPPGEYFPVEYRDHAEFGPVPERSKKTGTHCVSFADRMTIDAPPPIHRVQQFIDPMDRPYVTFVFKYRPRDLLRAQGIIPQTLVQIGEQYLQDVKIPMNNNPNYRDLASLKSRYDAMQAEAAAMAQEIAQMEASARGLPRNARAVKREDRVARLPAPAKPDVIDLTVDD